MTTDEYFDELSKGGKYISPSELNTFTKFSVDMTRYEEREKAKKDFRQVVDGVIKDGRSFIMFEQFKELLNEDK